MSASYTTKQADTLAEIAYHYYDGRQSGAVEAILEANPRLADYGVVLPLGVVMTLPDLEPETADVGVKLWD